MGSIFGLGPKIRCSHILVKDPGLARQLATELQAGGDFADGVIAHEARWLGGETFVSFDKRAVRLLNEQGTAARLL